MTDREIVVLQLTLVEVWDLRKPMGAIHDMSDAQIAEIVVILRCSLVTHIDCTLACRMAEYRIHWIPDPAPARLGVKI